MGVLDGVAADPVGPSGVNCGGQAGGKRRLGESQPPVDAHGAWSFDGDDRLGGAVNPAGFQLPAVTLQVVQAADPVAVCLGHPDRLSDAGRHVVPGAVADQGLGGHRFDFVKADQWHGPPP